MPDTSVIYIPYGSLYCRKFKASVEIQRYLELLSGTSSKFVLCAGEFFNSSLSYTTRMLSCLSSDSRSGGLCDVFPSIDSRNSVIAFKPPSSAIIKRRSTTACPKVAPGSRGRPALFRILRAPSGIGTSANAAQISEIGRRLDLPDGFGLEHPLTQGARRFLIVPFGFTNSSR